MFVRATILATLTTGLCLFFGGNDSLAQGKDQPKDKPTHAEDGEIKVGEKITMHKMVKQPDGTRKRVEVVRTIPEQKWKIGVVGWHDKTGFHLVQFRHLNDVEKNKEVESPVKAMRVTAPSGSVINASLIKGDQITLIDGFEVTNMTELIVAINSAADPKKLDIEILSSSTGKTNTGQLTAIKVKK